MASGNINTGSTPRLLLEGVKRLFGLSYEQLPQMYKDIYDSQKDDGNFVTAQGLAGVGVASKKNEGAAMELDDMSQSWTRITRHDVYSKRVKITKEAIDDNKYLKMMPVLSKELAKSLVHAKEINAAALFNNPTSTNAPYLGADGVAFLSTSHPTKKGGTYSNLSTGDLSELALENSVIQMQGWLGDDGLRIDVNPKTLLIPKESVFIAHRILKSDLQSGSANNDTNALKNMGMLQDVKAWRFISDTDAYFILTDCEGLHHYERTGVEFDSFMDDLTRDTNLIAMERYSFDYDDPRCVIGSVGA